MIFFPLGPGDDGLGHHNDEDDFCLLEESEDWVYEFPPPNGAWLTKNRDWLEVPRMSTKHIENCIKFLQRQVDIGEVEEPEIVEEWIKRFECELSYRNDPAFRKKYNLREDEKTN